MQHTAALKRVLPLFFWICWIATAHEPNPILSSYYVESDDIQLLRTLTEKFDLERRRGKGFEVIVPQERAAELLKWVPSAKLLERDIDDVFRRLDKTHPEWRRAFHNFNTVQVELKETVEKYPEISNLEEYGKTQEGRPLLVLRLTGLSLNAKTEILITSATHGDELITVELTMSLIQKLVQGYGSDPRITAILNNHIVYFIPVVCPDGYVRNQRYTNGVDPNRNYPYPGNPDKKSNLAIENEIRWVEKHEIVGSLDIHSNLAVVMYPWAYTSKAPAEEDVPKFKSITKLLAADTGYRSGQIAQVFGIARGSSADYWYWKKRTLSLGYEMAGRLIPEPKELNRAIERDTKAIFHFIEQF